MLNKLKRNQSGFTIIEVMIVLAIAGLILVIVLLAVPALKRNSYNTTIKNDASTVAGGVSDFESNNNGAPPTALALTSPVVSVTGAVGSTTTKVNASGTLKTLAAGTASITAGSPVATTDGLTTTGVIHYYIGYQCDGQSSNTSVALVYAIQTSATPTPQCLDS